MLLFRYELLIYFLWFGQNALWCILAKGISGSESPFAAFADPGNQTGLLAGGCPWQAVLGISISKVPRGHLRMTGCSLPMSIGWHVHPVRPVIGRVVPGCSLLPFIAGNVHEKDAVRNRALMLVDEYERAGGVFDLAKLGLSFPLLFRTVHVIAHGIAALSNNLRPVIDARPVRRAVIDRGGL